MTTLVGTFCFPIDTVKRRLMVQRKLVEKIGTTSTTTKLPPHLIPYKGGMDCVKRILAEEGIRGLFAGLSVNLVRSFSGAVLLVAYDDLKQRL